MAEFGRGRLCAPITDDDLRTVDIDSSTGAITVTEYNKFVIRVGGITAVAEVQLPISDAGLDYGYYTDATSEADSWAAALEVALDAADPSGGTWQVTELGGAVGGNVTRFVYTRTPSAQVQFLFSDILSSINSNLLGFIDNQDTPIGLSGTLTALYAAPHCWRPGTISWVTTEPLRTINQVKTASVKTSNSRTGGTQYREVIPSSNLPIAKVLLAGTVHDTDVAMVPNLREGDPNYPLEALWSVAWERLPLKWLPDETLPGENVKLLQVDGGQALSDIRSILTKRSTNLRFFDVDLPLIQWAPIGGKDFDIHAVVCSGSGDVVELSTLAEGLAQPEGTRVRMVQVADPANNIPALEHETTMVAGGWGPAGAAVGFKDLPSGRWAWGNIDNQVGAPGSTDRLLVYRSASAAPVTFNANKTITLTWTNGEAVTGYFNALKFVGIEVNIPIPTIEGSDIVIDNFPGTVGDSTLWQTFCGICNPTSIDKSIMSNLAAGSGVGGFTQSNQAVAAGALLVNATIATNPTYAGIPVRLQTQIAQSRVADDGWVVSFIPRAPETPYDGIQAVSPSGVQTDWVANDWVTFLAITNQTSADSWSVDSQTVLIPEPHFYNFAGGVPA